MARVSERRRKPAEVPGLLIDTNILLDVILRRAPWAEDAAELLDVIAHGDARGFVAAHSITTVYYVVGRELSHTRAVAAISDLLQIVEVVPLDGSDFQRAIAIGLKDYEDAVQVVACLRADAMFLVTRNQRDFKGATVEVRAPGEVLALVNRRRT